MQELKKKDLVRSLSSVEEKKGGKVTIQGKSCLDFSSNDYLGLSSHPLLKKRAQEFIEIYGVGSGASRLTCGNLSPYEEIERKIARLKSTQASLVLSTGFQANSTLIPALAGSSSVLLIDRLAHNSSMQGAILSRSKIVRYRHNDLGHLEQLLHRHARSLPAFVITESVFSMDGDQCDLGLLGGIAKKYNAFVYVDEAHATGVFGSEGEGLCVGKPVDLVMGTCSKALGAFGAFAACSQSLKDYLVNSCSGLIYSTALPPPVLGAIDAALDLIPLMKKERKQLFRHVERVQRELKRQGWNLSSTTSPIIPLILSEATKALLLSKKLWEKGIFAYAVRPPTVAAGTSRVRISLSAAHTEEDIDYLISTLSTLAADFV